MRFFLSFFLSGFDFLYSYTTNLYRSLHRVFQLVHSVHCFQCFCVCAATYCFASWTSKKKIFTEQHPPPIVTVHRSLWSMVDEDFFCARQYDFIFTPTKSINSHIDKDAKKTKNINLAACLATKKFTSRWTKAYPCFSVGFFFRRSNTWIKVIGNDFGWLCWVKWCCAFYVRCYDEFYRSGSYKLWE